MFFNSELRIENWELFFNSELRIENWELGFQNQLGELMIMIKPQASA